MAELAAVVVAAGKSTRFGRERNKVYLSLGDKPVLSYSLDTLEASSLIKEIVVVIAAGEEELFQKAVLSLKEYRKLKSVVQGGLRRTDSVYQGLQEIAAAEFVAVHDGARPLFSSALLERVFEAANLYGAAVPALKPKDTVKMIDERGLVLKTLPRENLRLIQTPQIFKRENLVQAYSALGKLNFTDDASLLEESGFDVKTVEGEEENLKITFPADLELAEYYLQKRRKNANGNRL